MSTPTRPVAYPLWTQGNESARQQPTNGQQFTGYVPNFRPPAGQHNWLFGIMSDWISWLDFITANPSSFPVSNVGHNIATGSNLQAQLDEIDAFLSSLGLQGLTMSPTANPLVYNVAPLPLNSAQPLVFLDGIDQAPTTDFTWAVVSGQGQVTFAVAPAPGQIPIAVALTSNNPGSGGSNVTGGFVAYGSAASPVTIVAASGVTEPGDQRSLMFTVSTGGITPITSSPQISAGTKIGQEFRIVGTSSSNAISLADGNGLLLNGPITLGNGVSLDLYWNGAVWAESDRSN